VSTIYCNSVLVQSVHLDPAMTTSSMFLVFVDPTNTILILGSKFSMLGFALLLLLLTNLRSTLCEAGAN